MMSLDTFLCEVEPILNDRPITISSMDPNNLEALTPNHLLLLKNSTIDTSCSISKGGFVCMSQMETSAIHV